jgi:uroporphyrinogen-III synthase
MKSLENKVIISTRPLSADDSMHDHLIGKGATVIEFPMIEIVKANIVNNIEEALSNIKAFNWIVFTSKNGVNYFFDILEKLTGNKTIPTSVKIASIGFVTTRELEKNGTLPYFVSKGCTSTDLLKELSIGNIKPGSNILLPLGNLANDTLEKGFSSFANATRIDVYKTIETKTVSPEIIERIKKDNYDLIIFTSPSGFINFTRIMKENECAHKFRMACIGSTTEKEILQNGFKPLLVSTKSDGISFAQEIENYYLNIHLKK